MRTSRIWSGARPLGRGVWDMSITAGTARKFTIGLPIDWMPE